MAARPKRASHRPASARERIEHAAYELFSRHGIRAIGVNTLAERAGVAKMTLYKHYPSKDALALAFLRRREELWTRSWLQREVEHRARTPRAKLLAVFDAFDRWFQRADYEACSFAKALLEHGERGHPVRDAAVRHIETLREFLGELAKAAQVRHPDDLARQWLMLMMGCILAAYAGDLRAARRARKVGAALLAQEGKKGTKHEVG